MNKKSLFLGLLSCILTLIVLRRCDHKRQGDINDVHLKPQENTAIIVNTDTGQVTTITRGNNDRNKMGFTGLRGRNPQPSEVSADIIKRTEGVRDLRISIDDRGNVSYIFRTWGFQFSPEAGTCYASSSHAGITINDSFFFYRKHGALIGLRFAIAGSKDIKPYIGYTYNPQWKYLNNTSIVFGVDSDKQFVLGTSTHF